MKAIFVFLKPYKKGLLLSTLAMAVATVCELLLPTIMSDILNRGVYNRNFFYIVICCACMLILSGVSLGMVLWGSFHSCRVVAGFCADVRQEVFRKVNAMSFEEFGKLGAAAVTTRATHDVQTVSWIASEMCGTVATIPMLFVGGVVLTMRKDFVLALTLLAFVPVILAIVILLGRRIVPLWEKSDEYIDRQNDIMRQRLRGIRVIRAFRAEEREHEKIADATRIMAENIIRGNVAMGLITPLATFLLNLAAVLIVYLGGWRMESGSGLTGADVFAIIQYVSLVSSSVIMGAFTIIMFPHAQVASKRIGQVLHAEGLPESHTVQEQEIAGDIRFENVSFCYKGAAEPAVNHLNLHIKSGQRISVIGGTGSGKSTIVSLLLGFRVPTEGRIYMDGIPASELGRHRIREGISCVLQNAAVYSGTVRENVSMGNPNVSEDDMIQALEIAQAWDFVNRFPDGLDHVLNQSGKNLSGGQKQRLCIARAIVKEAPIYIFDDSFSALDFLTEAKLREGLKKKISGKTQIIITQRVTSAMHSDCIFVMDRGCLTDSGTHGELLQRCEVYRQIYASQTGGDAV